MSTDLKKLIPWSFGITFLLSFILGLLVYPKIFPGPKIPISTQTPDSLKSAGPAKPDTVWLETKPKYFAIHDTLYLSGRPDYVKNPLPPIVDDEESSSFQVGMDSNFVSYKLFDLEPYQQSKIWAWSKCPVDSFKNVVIFRYQKYLDEMVIPAYENDIKLTRNHNLLKGLFAGALLGGGMVTKKWYIILPAAVVGAGVVIYF